MAPQAEINTLATLLNRCASTAGGRSGEGTSCGFLFQATGGASITDTLEAVQSIARNGGGAALSELMDTPLESGAFRPVLSTPPASWKLAVKFDVREWKGAASVPLSSGNWAKGAVPFLDMSGNVWTFDFEDHTILEFIGSAALEPEGKEASPNNTEPAGKP
jgi:hypothetical protein